MNSDAKTTQLNSLFIDDTPLLDVRAPIEFAKGAFPAATNHPILNDDERHQVGLCYQASGQKAATELGYRLVSGDVKESRIATWCKFVQAHPEAQLYCFRGGERSSIASQWLKDAGINIPRIAGGYKRLRNHLLTVFDCLPSIVIVSGQTGTGKTEFLTHFTQAIDLEGLANHRGSAFGGHIKPQPSQIDFENALAIQFLKKSGSSEILLEDESRLIGRINVPPLLQEKMKTAPIIVVDESLQVRVERIYQEYIDQQWQEYTTFYLDDAPSQFERYLLTAVDAIRKRLGGDAHALIRKLMEDAINQHARGGGLEAHKAWITTLLSDYYDPMYNYQIDKKSERIRVRGTREELTAWYENNHGFAKG